LNLELSPVHRTSGCFFLFSIIEFSSLRIRAGYDSDHFIPLTPFSPLRQRPPVAPPCPLSSALSLRLPALSPLFCQLPLLSCLRRLHRTTPPSSPFFFFCASPNSSSVVTYSAAGSSSVPFFFRSPPPIRPAPFFSTLFFIHSLFFFQCCSSPPLRRGPVVYFFLGGSPSAFPLLSPLRERRILLHTAHYLLPSTVYYGRYSPKTPQFLKALLQAHHTHFNEKITP